MTARPIPSNEFFQDWSHAPVWKAAQRHWYWFILSPVLCVLLGLLFLRYKTPRYHIAASLLVRDDSRGGDFRDNALLEELGLPNATSSVENEIELLKSRKLLAGVISHLQLTTQYFASGKLKTTELYEKSPYRVRFLKARTGDAGTYHIIEQPGGKFVLRTSKAHYPGAFGKPVELPHGLAVVEKTHFKPAAHDTYSFTVSAPETILDNYRRALSIQAPNKTASLVNLSIQEVLPRKGEAILKQLIALYQQASIAEKNKVADNTIAFINANLERVSSELSQVESEIEVFRRRHRVTDVAEDSRRTLQRQQDNDAEEKELAVRLKITQLLQAHLRSNPSAAVPSALYQQEHSFSALVVQYNDLQQQYAKMLVTVSPDHPTAKAFQSQLTLVRGSLLDAVAQQANELALSIRSLRTYEKRYQSAIAQIPSVQRQFLSQSREQGIQQDLYLFLLKKRMETAISRSANIANARVIDPPKASPLPSFPNRQLTLLVAMMAGVLIPAAAIYTCQILNTRITSKDEILQHCNVPVLGEVGQQRSFRHARWRDNRNQIREQFRSLRTNIRFTTGDRECTVILITSAMANEGKSFVASQLAHSLALADRKVLLIDFDLRKPSLAKLLHGAPDGICEAVLHDTEPRIQRAGNAHAFDFLAAGTRQNGAAEILLSPRITEFFGCFRTDYDYILVDSPPVGLVADARLIGSHADMTLYIVRQHFTYKHQLTDIQRARDQSLLPDVHIVLNGTRDLHRYQYSYY